MSGVPNRKRGQRRLVFQQKSRGAKMGTRVHCGSAVLSSNAGNGIGNDSRGTPPQWICGVEEDDQKRGSSVTAKWREFTQ